MMPYLEAILKAYQDDGYGNIIWVSIEGEIGFRHFYYSAPCTIDVTSLGY